MANTTGRPSVATGMSPALKDMDAVAPDADRLGGFARILRCYATFACFQSAVSCARTLLSSPANAA